MKIYIVEACFYDGESGWENFISVRYDKLAAEFDKIEYENIRATNIDLAQKDYDYIYTKLPAFSDEEYTEEESILYSKLYEAERTIHDDFVDVRITEVEADTLLYLKENIIYKQLVKNENN